MKHNIYLLLLFSILCSKTTIAQIAITEIYFDTPFSERPKLTDMHNSGEYIELFNYTTEDIDISNWRLNSYIFPEGTIIGSGDFIIVAWDVRKFDSNFFSSFFPTTQGNESKVYYQRDFVLGNLKGEITLRMTSIRGIKLERWKETSKINWNMPKTTFQYSWYKPATFTESGDFNYNFDYYRKSFQLTGQNEFEKKITYNASTLQSSSFRDATPMQLDYPVELVPLESIPGVIDAILNNYDHFIGDSGVLELLNTICDKHVSLIVENNINDDVVNTLCPKYDESGNFIGLNNICIHETQYENDSYEELDYASMIWVAPNPTRDKTTIHWDKDIVDLISEIVVVPVNGGQHITINYLTANESAEINLSTYPSGIYVVRFLFSSGQVVTKSIIKI